MQKLKSINHSISLSGLINLDDKSNTLIKFKDINKETINEMLSEEDKDIYKKFSATINQFKRHSSSYDEYPSFEAGTGKIKTRIIKVGGFIVAIDSEHICRFDTIEDMYEGGSGVCVSIENMGG